MNLNYSSSSKRQACYGARSLVHSLVVLSVRPFRTAAAAGCTELLAGPKGAATEPHKGAHGDRTGHLLFGQVIVNQL